MYSEAQLHALHDRLFRQMMLAGWIDHFSHTKDRGWFVAWTELGAEHVACLNAISESFGLCADDRAPTAFDIVCNGGDFPGFSGNPPEAAAAFWRARVAELKIVQDPDELLVLVHIAKEWG